MNNDSKVAISMALIAIAVVLLILGADRIHRIQVRSNLIEEHNESIEAVDSVDVVDKFLDAEEANFERDQFSRQLYAVFSVSAVLFILAIFIYPRRGRKQSKK